VTTTQGWRIANASDDDAIVTLCLGLYQEDPSPHPVPSTHTRHTLDTLRQQPIRGLAVILELDNKEIAGYALLISYWSNELGGEVCQVDELYVTPPHRSQGHATNLFNAIEQGHLWPNPIVAMALMTTAGNASAQRLYQRVGFKPAGPTFIRRIRRP
jgi:GNAT superfamily N-acetyltransferase